MWKKSKQLSLVYIGVWNIFLDMVIHLLVLSLLSSSLTSRCFSRHNPCHTIYYSGIIMYQSVWIIYVCWTRLVTCYFVLVLTLATFSLCTFEIILCLWGFEFSLHMVSHLNVLGETSANSSSTFCLLVESNWACGETGPALTCRRWERNCNMKCFCETDLL